MTAVRPVAKFTRAVSRAVKTMRSDPTAVALDVPAWTWPPAKPR